MKNKIKYVIDDVIEKIKKEIKKNKWNIQERPKVNMPKSTMHGRVKLMR